MDIEKLSGVQLGHLVNSKQISPVEVIDYTEKRISERNADINAFVYTKFDEAREDAKKLESRIMNGEYCGLLAGVPVGLKDFLPSKKGWTASHGGVPNFTTVDEADSTFYQAAVKEGAIAVGKTNAPSFGFRGVTDNNLYGPTSTPFNVNYNSGGSSGGSASAVADGLVPLAEGGDAGGSVRIPSAWCLCFGFKPSAGAVPSVCRPDAWTATHPYCCSGPITRTVEDAAVILSNMVRYDPRDPISVPLGVVHFDEAMVEDIKGLRIGVTYDFGIFPTPDPEIVSAVNETAAMLQELGCRVDYVDFKLPEYTLSQLEEAWLVSISLDSALDMKLSLYDINGDFRKLHENDLPKEFFEYADKALRSTMLDYRMYHELRTKIIDSHLAVFNDYDIVIAPVSGCMPVLNGPKGQTAGPSEINGQPVNPLIGFAQTYLENMTGFPAASVPFGLSESGLPIGIQVIANRYFDRDVFAVAHALEQINPWSHLYEIAYNRKKS